MPISDDCEMNVVSVALICPHVGMAGCEYDHAVDCRQPDGEKVGAPSKADIGELYT